MVIKGLYVWHRVDIHFTNHIVTVKMAPLKIIQLEAIDRFSISCWNYTIIMGNKGLYKSLASRYSTKPIANIILKFYGNYGFCVIVQLSR